MEEIQKNGRWRNIRFEYVDKNENICPYTIDHVAGLDYTGNDLGLLTELLNKQDQRINDLEKQVTRYMLELGKVNNRKKNDK